MTGSTAARLLARAARGAVGTGRSAWSLEASAILAPGPVWAPAPDAPPAGRAADAPAPPPEPAPRAEAPEPVPVLPPRSTPPVLRRERPVIAPAPPVPPVAPEPVVAVTLPGTEPVEPALPVAGAAPPASEQHAPEADERRVPAAAPPTWWEREPATAASPGAPQPLPEAGALAPPAPPVAKAPAAPERVAMEARLPAALAPPAVAPAAAVAVPALTVPASGHAAVREHRLPEAETSAPPPAPSVHIDQIHVVTPPAKAPPPDPFASLQHHRVGASPHRRTGTG